MYRSLGDLENAGFKYVCHLLHPKEELLVSSIVRKNHTFFLVEEEAFGKYTLKKCTSAKKLLSYIRNEYSFAHAKKAQLFIKGVR